MPYQAIDGFLGLDVRKSSEVADKRTSRVAHNVYLTVGHEYETAPSFVHVGDLPSDSVGLYVIGDRLRTVRPRTAWSGLPGSGVLSSVAVDYDYIEGYASGTATAMVSFTQGSYVFSLVPSGDVPVEWLGATITVGTFSATVTGRVSSSSSVYDGVLSVPWPDTSTTVPVMLSGVRSLHPGNLVRLGSAFVYGASSDIGPFPYLTVETSAGVEHHWIKSPDKSVQILVPWPLSLAAIPAVGKVWTYDKPAGVVRFCSVLHGPTNWTEPGDAGYIPIVQHCVGTSEVIALALYDDKLAVVLQDAIQLWDIDPDPNAIQLNRVIGGSGTPHARTVVNVVGDLFYRSFLGFRSLRTQVFTGQIQEEDGIGAPIDLLVSSMGSDSGVAVWSGSTGRYICAIDTTAYVLLYRPKADVVGWTTLTLPEPVDYMVEHNTTVYARAGNRLYALHGPSPTWTVETPELAGTRVFNQKLFTTLEVVFSGGPVRVSYLVPRGSSEVEIPGPVLPYSTRRRQRFYIGIHASGLRIKFSGTRPCTLSGYAIEYQELER